MEKAKIQVISTCTIKSTRIPCKNESKIQLTPFDLHFLFFDYVQTWLLFNKPTRAQEDDLMLSKNTTFIDHLKASLSKTLSFFAPFAGRLTTNEVVEIRAGSCNFSLDCNNDGVPFIHAIANNLSISEILNPSTLPSIIHSFFPLNGVRSYQGISQPLLAIQVTEISDGLFIGCSFSHLVCDGFSFWHFLNSWARISRGVDAISKLQPVLKRSFPNFDIEFPISIGNEEFIANILKLLHDPPLEKRFFHFSKENITKLKEKANLEMNTDKISSLQALIAYMWISMLCSQSIDANQETSFAIYVEYRNRLNPPLPKGYFGNASFPALVTLKVGEICNRGLGWTAWQINRMVASCGHEQIKNVFRSWVKKPKFLNTETIRKNFYTLANSPRFNIYGNDFGWGKPIIARIGEGNRFDGKVTIYTGAEQGSVDIEVLCLSDWAMARM